MAARLLHLHTYFLFPFSIDKETVLEEHGKVWPPSRRWIDGLDDWLAWHKDDPRSNSLRALGRWKRAAYSRFDADSPAYQDMVFFHPVVRRVFFDTTDESGGAGGHEALLRCYEIPIPQDARLWLEASDLKGRGAKVEVTDLRLFLFANGMGILSIGVEAFNLTAAQGLWINETLRKVYPSSARQVREGRFPNRIALTLERAGAAAPLVEEAFERAEMTGMLPPLSRTITDLLYFTDYSRQEYEPVLDERMIVYTYFGLDPTGLPEGFLQSEDYQVLLSRFLYVDRAAEGYRYEPEFTRQQMERQLYRRWAHQGTYYGFTSYSNITATVGAFDCDEHQLHEGFLIHRMFSTRYYLMALVALFYRAALLDFSERTAMVSKQLYLDQEDNRFALENIRLASDLRGDFLHFSNYWYFYELANKDEENEHFAMQCREYRIQSMKGEIEEEIEKLNASLHNFYQFRNTEAVNRLTVLSLLLGAGAVVTGFFGMNFGRDFARFFFEPDKSALPAHYAALIFVVLMAFGTIGFGLFVVARNWSDYWETLATQRTASRGKESASLRKGLPPRR
ncbi:MAG: hypothetical protein IT159_00710 [Bryobacterales bacterium]|nr:hypothetical protein [Bryobacterales bacterium]